MKGSINIYISFRHRKLTMYDIKMKILPKEVLEYVCVCVREEERMREGKECSIQMSPMLCMIYH